ncbi:MAG: hypothetical protein D6744_14755 [Planctomycetota bacterium]|nr:MAG: hypothetical protein D6744_14755 [Planctomycetota bacterium]
MPLTETDQRRIDAFRTAVEKRLSDDGRLGPMERDDREDGSSLASRFRVGEHLWIELCLRPLIPQLRAGIVTDDRWVSEDLEQAIEDSGDSMSEFVELGFDEVDLDEPEPVVEHYRDRGKYFYFSTGFELDSLERLDDDRVRDRITRMCLGYYEAFRPAIEKAAAES